MTDEHKTATKKVKTKVPSDKLEPVYFLSLEVERVLCFKNQQTLDLSDGNGNPAQWTVILGDNGVGKTTLLRCLAGMELFGNSKNDQSNEYKGNLPLLFRYHGSKSIRAWKELETLFKYIAKVGAMLACNIALADLKQDNESTIQRIQCSVEVGWNVSTSDKWEKVKELQCYGYGATRNTTVTSLSESTADIFENSASLFSEENSLINAEEWLLQTDYAYRSASGKTKDKLEKQFTQVIEVLKRILPDIEDIRILSADKEYLRPKAEFKTPYGWVQFSGLGLGYRTMIAWMVDLAVRLFIRYPNSKDPLAEPAIVLVDEIDLHLHPKWQRTIMSFLTERFPNTQFIVTAHSPLVVQAAKDANIVLLRREGDHVVIDNDPEIIDNWRVDQVLTSVFELPTARSTDLEPLLARRQKLLSKAKLTKKDEAELRELASKIGSLPTAETPDDIKAMDIIRRAAKLLENS